MMGEVSLETSPKNICVQDMINSENSKNTTESANTNIFKMVVEDENRVGLIDETMSLALTTCTLQFHANQHNQTN